MRRPWLLIGWLVPLAGCDWGYQVQHRADGPLSFDVRMLQDALRTQPGFHEGEQCGGTSTWAIERPPGWAIVWCNAEWPTPNGEVGVGATWLNMVPGDDELFASIALQQDLVALLARTVPGFPGPAAFGIEWGGLDFPLGDELAAAKARWEARAREK